jgi:hypothetical protein
MTVNSHRTAAHVDEAFEIVHGPQRQLHGGLNTPYGEIGCRYLQHIQLRNATNKLRIGKSAERVSEMQLTPQHNVTEATSS